MPGADWSPSGSTTQVVIDGWRLSPETVAWGAEQTVRMHEEAASYGRPTAGRCARCPDDGSGCRQLAMARAVLSAFDKVRR